MPEGREQRRVHQRRGLAPLGGRQRRAVGKGPLVLLALALQPGALHRGGIRLGRRCEMGAEAGAPLLQRRLVL